jgi:hypothetical protein
MRQKASSKKVTGETPSKKASSKKVAGETPSEKVFSTFSPGVIRVASFDIGSVNFAHYVEEVDVATLKMLDEKYHSLPLKLRRKVKGPMRVQNIRGGTDEHVSDVRNLFGYLSSLSKVWDTCDIFIVEQQFFKTATRRGVQKGSAANVDAIKLGEATLSWFIIHYPNALVDYISSTYKTQILGAPLTLSKPQRKKWSVDKAREILEERGDAGAIMLYSFRDTFFKKRPSEEKIVDALAALSEDCSEEDILYMAEKSIRERQKMDDVSDCLIQLQAFNMWYLVGNF